jgi:hypothetical protein
LNVSRELLQESRDVKAIREGCTKRVLGMLEDLAKNDKLPQANADGVTDVQSADGEAFGEERLKEFLRTAVAEGRDAEQACALLSATLTRFRGSRPAFDDVTVLVLGRSAAMAGISEPLGNP